MSDLDLLVREWETKVAKIWREFRSEKGSFISVYNPRWTLSEDLRARKEASEKTAEYAVKWFRDRGYGVSCTVGGDDGESVILKYDDAEILHAPEVLPGSDGQPSSRSR